MYLVISPDTSFNGDFAGYKFKAGKCITKLDDNLCKWFKMLGFKVENYTKPEKKEETLLTEEKKEEVNEDK